MPLMAHALVQPRDIMNPEMEMISISRDRADLQLLDTRIATVPHHLLYCLVLLRSTPGTPMPSWGTNVKLGGDGLLITLDL